MESKTAIVTGASSGIGLGIARALLAHSYHVVATARNITKAGVLESSERCVLVDGNVADRAFGVKLSEAAVARTGRINLLVNNAGIFVPGNFHEYTEEQYRSIIYQCRRLLLRNSARRPSDAQAERRPCGEHLNDFGRATREGP
jgi:NAD(P)-dependent dehydrogenase (short-subunit alcohol dehydrogenase family)